MQDVRVRRPIGPIRRAALAATGLALCGAGAPALLAQAADGVAGPTVSWAVAGPAAVKAKRGGRAALLLQATVREGWHVYALKQRPDGPTPLRVTVDANDLARAEGSPAGSPPITAFEPAFGQVTPYYVRTLTLTVPVRLQPNAAPGRRIVPVSVRFQTCNGRVCEPPKTVRLSVPVDVAAKA